MDWLEWGLIVFVGIYGFVFLLGRHRNRYIGKAVINTAVTTLRPYFPLQTLPFTYPLLSIESQYQFKSILSGHPSAVYASISTELIPRHELLSLIVNYWVYPMSDVVNLEIPCKGLGGRVMVVRKDWEKGVEKHFPGFVRGT